MLERAAKHHPGWVILTILFALLGIGIIMMYSSSAIYAEKTFGSPYHFLTRQLVSLAIGLLVLRLAIKVDYRVYQKFVPPLMVICFVLLLLVLIPGVGS